ncbi:MAG: sugar kinase, partial [Pseudomonadota bacterium]
VFEGNQRNAGAFGPLPVADKDGVERQLIELASISTLETRLVDAGEDPRQLWQQPQDWAHLDRYVEPWLDQAARALATAMVAACAIIDFEAVVIDGAMPGAVRKRLIYLTRMHLATKDLRGLIAPVTAEGQIGANARGIGAAAGPVISQLMLDRSAAMLDHG